MPPLPPISSVLRLSLLYRGTPPLTGANVLYLKYPSSISGFTATDCVAIANGAGGWWTTRFAPSICASWSLNQVLATAVDGTGVQGVSTFATRPGTLAETALPPQCTACISWVGAPAYRGGKPRTYLPGLSTLQITAATSTLKPTFAATLKAAAIAALADMTWTTIGGVQAQLGTVSYIRKSVNPTPPHYRSSPVFYTYLSANVHERVDSQRRRSGKEAGFLVA